MLAGDAVTRIKRYWPISREQLSRANRNLLFPVGTIRTATFTLEELNSAFNFAFNFDLLFKLNTPSRRFGSQPTAQAAIETVRAILGFIPIQERAASQPTIQENLANEADMPVAQVNTLYLNNRNNF